MPDNKFWEHSHRPGGRGDQHRFDRDEYLEQRSTDKPLTGLGNQTSGHEETWNTQDNGLWQALRDAGEAYRDTTKTQREAIERRR